MEPARSGKRALGHARECPGCGLFQSVPALAPGTTASCARCGTRLEHTSRYAIEQNIALTLTALFLLLIMTTTTLMNVETAGIRLTAGLFSGPAELVRRGMGELAAVIVFVTVIAPFGKLLGTLYVLIRLREPNPPRHLPRVFVVVEKLRPWSMIDVFVFGVFVAYVKLGDVVTIGLGVGVYALLALTFVIIWADGALDREAIWEALDRHDQTSGPSASASRDAIVGAIGCEVCGLVSLPRATDPACPRCGARLHARKPNSIPRTWALVLAAAVLYVPANYYPVLTVMQLGAGAPSTILGGVEELFAARMYPLALLVFVASIAIPLLKLIGLAAVMIATQTASAEWLPDRTRLCRVIRLIGRWSMIDIFMEALLGALVRFGNVITIEPGIGAISFCAVVILTMLAAECFDPRLMWDAADRGNVRTKALSPG